jgi:hypothetical protein
VENIEARTEIERKHPGILPWIIGLILLALVMTGLILALRSPRPVGVDDGTAPAAVQDGKSEQPRSLRQYASASPQAAFRAA